MVTALQTGKGSGDNLVPGRSKEHPPNEGNVSRQISLKLDSVNNPEFPADPKTGLLLARPLRGAISFTFEVEHGDRRLKFSIDVLSGSDYIKYWEQWRDQVMIPLYARGFKRDLDLATRLVNGKMRVGREEARKEHLIPSGIVVRRIDPEPDVYVGEAIERVYIVPTTEGDIPLLSYETRVFEEQFRNMELGRLVAKYGRLTHRMATWGAHRARVETSPRSLQRSAVFREGRYFPYDAFYTSDFLALQILNAYFAIVRLNGKYVGQEYGASFNDYPDPTGELDFDPLHPSLEAIHRLFLRARVIPQDPEKRRHSKNSIYGVGEIAR